MNIAFLFEPEQENGSKGCLTKLDEAKATRLKVLVLRVVELRAKREKEIKSYLKRLRRLITATGRVVLASADYALSPQMTRDKSYILTNRPVVKTQKNRIHRLERRLAGARKALQDVKKTLVTPGEKESLEENAVGVGMPKVSTQ